MVPRPRTSTLFPYTTLFRSDGYDEAMSAANPFEAHVAAVDRTMGVAKLRAEWTQALGERLDATLWAAGALRSEEHTSELQSQFHLVCRLLLEKKKQLQDDPT